MARALTNFLLVTVAVALLGGSGWLAWTLYIRQDQTAHQLWEAEASLKKTQSALEMLEAERQRLSEEYDTLKERWAKTSQELQDLSSQSAEFSTRLTALSDVRAQLQSKLDEQQRQALQLHTQVASLRHDVAQKEYARAQLDTQLQVVSSQRLNPSELEQLAAAIDYREEETQRLRQRVAEFDERMVASEPSASTAQPKIAPTPSVASMPRGLHEAVEESMNGYANRQSLPRKDRDLVWSWLTQ